MTWFYFWNPKTFGLIQGVSVSTPSKTYYIDMDHWHLAKPYRKKKKKKKLPADISPEQIQQLKQAENLELERLKQLEIDALRALIEQINGQFSELSSLQMFLDQSLQQQAILQQLNNLDELYHRALIDAEEKRKALYELELIAIQNELNQLIETTNRAKRIRQENDLLMCFLMIED